jgi:hypothetical protein
MGTSDRAGRSLLVYGALSTLLVACGTFLPFDGDPESGGETADGSASSDGGVLGEGASVIPASCRLDRPFGSPAPVTELNTAAGETSARLSANGLELVLTRVVSGIGRLYLATRTQPVGSFGAPALLDLGGAEQRHGSLSGDGLALYFATETFQKTIAHSVRTGTGFAGEQQIDLELPGQHFEPFVSGDERVLYFIADLGAGAGNQIFVSARANAGEPFGQPVDVPELNVVSGDKGLPTFTADERTIYFSAPAVGRADSDIYVASRATSTDRWSNPMPVTELSTTSDDRPVWVSQDGCTIYLVSDRIGGGGGGFDVWRAERP